MKLRISPVVNLSRFAFVFLILVLSTLAVLQVRPAGAQTQQEQFTGTGTLSGTGCQGENNECYTYQESATFSLTLNFSGSNFVSGSGSGTSQNSLVYMVGPYNGLTCSGQGTQDATVQVRVDLIYQGEMAFAIDSFPTEWQVPFTCSDGSQDATTASTFNGGPLSMPPVDGASVMLNDSNASNFGPANVQGSITIHLAGSTTSSSVSTGTTATTLSSVTTTAPTSATTGTTVVPLPSLSQQDKSEFQSMLNKYGQPLWQSTSTLYDCLQQAAGTLSNTCVENGYKFTFGGSASGLGQDVAIEQGFELVKGAALSYFGAAWKVPFAIVYYGGTAYFTGNRYWELGQLLQNPQSAQGTTSLGPLTVTIQPTASTLFNQQAMIAQGVQQDVAQWVSTHQDSLQFVQTGLDTSTSQVVSLTGMQTSAVDLDCSPSASCTPSITATVPSLDSVFTLAVALPANLTAALNASPSATASSQAEPSAGTSIAEGLLGLAILALIILLPIYLVARAIRHRKRAKVGPVLKQQATASSESARKPPPPARSYCTECGKSVQPTDKYCPSCGYRLPQP